MSEFRLLTREELETVPGMPDPLPTSLFAIGMVDEQGVAAACGIFLVLHADPLWIRPDKRNGGKLLLRLWEATRAEISRGQLGPEVLWVGTAEDQDTGDLVGRLCETAGGSELKAKFFVIPVGE